MSPVDLKKTTGLFKLNTVVVLKIISDYLVFTKKTI